MSDQDNTADKPTEGAKDRVWVPFDEPIRREGGDLAGVNVRRPLPETMDGLSMRDIVDMEAKTMRILLPRITEPMLIREEIAVMNPGDFLLLSAEASGFLLPRALREASPQA